MKNNTTTLPIDTSSEISGASADSANEDIPSHVSQIFLIFFTPNYVSRVISLQLLFFLSSLKKKKKFDIVV